MLDVHIFIVNYASSDMLERCLESLEGEPYTSILVIDNFSTQDERDRLLQLSSIFDINVLFLEGNMGFGPAMNRGLEHVKLTERDAIWLLNPDTSVDQGSLSRLVRYLEEEDYDIISPTIVTGEDKTQSIWFSGGVLDRASIKTQHLGFGLPVTEVGPLTNNTVNTFITGAAMFMSFTTWKHLGGFREDFFLYWEDADLCERAVTAGLRLGVCDQARIWHEVGGTGRSEGKSPVYYFYMQRNRVWLAKDWGRSMSLLLGPGLLETLLLLARPIREKVSPWQKFRASLSGLLQGFNTESRMPLRVSDKRTAE